MNERSLEIHPHPFQPGYRSGVLDWAYSLSVRLDRLERCVYLEACAPKAEAVGKRGRISGLSSRTFALKARLPAAGTSLAPIEVSAPCTPGSWLCLRGCRRVMGATFVCALGLRGNRG